ncbi:MAG: hypothetical protein JW797_08775 [Bradymonadales bacterium]|nr:hypothetical protein [Bradymonadales bacterium]
MQKMAHETLKCLVVAGLMILSAALPRVGMAAYHVGPDESKVWTYLVYMAGDNNLDYWGSYSLDLIQQGMTDDSQVHVVVLFDHYQDYAELIVVHPEGLEVLVGRQDAFEPDMGDPETLQRFLEWGMESYDADHFALVLWDHGGGWKNFATDDDNGSRMMIDGMVQAIAMAEDQAERWVDLVVFDACLMAMIEVAYELREVTDYLVASTHTVDSDGFPYHTMLQELIDDPGQTTWEYAKLIVDRYYDFVERTNAHAGLAGSAIRVAEVEPIVLAIDALAEALMADMSSHHGSVAAARAIAEHQTWGGGAAGWFWYMDLWTFADEIAGRIDDDAVFDAARAIQEGYADRSGEAIVYAHPGKTLERFMHGLTLHFPPSRARHEGTGYLGQDYEEVGLDFTRDTAWDEMLQEFYRGQ